MLAELLLLGNSNLPLTRGPAHLPPRRPALTAGRLRGEMVAHDATRRIMSALPSRPVLPASGVTFDVVARSPRAGVHMR